MLLYLLLGAITLLGIILLKAYTHLPQVELRRRARGGDHLAELLYKAASYGSSLEIVLWTIIGLSATSFFLVVDKNLPGWMAVMASLLLLWLGFAWIPSTPVSRLSMNIARMLANPLAWFLQQAYPLTNWFAIRTGRFRLSFHTGLYEKDDLLDFLSAQAGQPDSRISAEELKLAHNSLLFGDKIVREAMTPIKQTKVTYADDALGPVLLTELHELHHGIFPVRESRHNKEIVGVLNMYELQNASKGGKIRDYMHNNVGFMDDETTLDIAIREFFKTRSHLFVVKNSLDENVGVITIDDILEQIIGQPLDDLVESGPEEIEDESQKNTSTEEA